MALQAALGSALSWAKGPVPQTFAAWTRACELADVLADLEVQLQAHYGLWLYHLRRGQYSRSLEHATRMMDLARTAGDLEGLAAGMRIAGVSRHFVGEHAAARALIEDALAWYESGNTKQAFRFGLDQRVAGLAFLSRILWVQGYSSEARKTASAALDEARALDHACSLCCALAEGWCMVHALDGDAETVAQGAEALVRTASAHGLGFWRAYGEIFMSWSVARRSRIPVTGEQISLLLQALDKINFDAGYSTLLADLLLTADPARNRAVAAAVDTGFLTSVNDDDHWASPEFARVGAQLSIADLSCARSLETALQVARRQGARAWELKIAIDLSEALLKEQRGLEAVRVLETALSSLPVDHSSKGWREATSLHDRLIQAPGI